MKVTSNDDVHLPELDYEGPFGIVAVYRAWYAATIAGALTLILTFWPAVALFRAMQAGPMWSILAAIAVTAASTVFAAALAGVLTARYVTPHTGWRHWARAWITEWSAPPARHRPDGPRRVRVPAPPRPLAAPRTVRLVTAPNQESRCVHPDCLPDARRARGRPQP